jgi:SPP1 family predicted phage head-tail adaptor
MKPLGGMIHQIALQSDGGSNSGGFQSESWSTQATVYAAVEMQDSRDINTADKDTGADVVLFRIHYRADVTSAWRVQFNSQNYEIIAPPVNADFRNRETLIKARLIT